MAPLANRSTRGLRHIAQLRVGHGRSIGCCRALSTGPRGRLSKFQKPVRRSLQQRRQSSPPRNNEPAKSISRTEAVSTALRTSADNAESGLLAPVHIPEDAHAILNERHPSSSILANSSLIIQRQLEMLNVFIGFEQANKYVIMNPHGDRIGFLAEQEHGIGNALARQAFRTHRSFTTHVFDRDQREVLRFYRPFSWINSRIQVFDVTTGDNDSSSGTESITKSADIGSAPPKTSSLPLSSMRIIGEAHQQWAPLRRRYNLFLHRPESAPDGTLQLTSGDLPLCDSKALEPVSEKLAQSPASVGIMSGFAYVNEPFLSWDFALRSANDDVIGSVNRNFSGFAREIFTDTGVYALRMDSESLAAESAASNANGIASTMSQPIGMTLDQRAVMLATAVSIDFDYFSRHSSRHSDGMMMFPFWWGGGAEAGGAAAGGAAAGAEGTAAEAGAIATGRAAEGAITGAGGIGAGMSEGVMTGAGAMAGYEAMQRGMGRRQDGADDASPQAGDVPQGQSFPGEHRVQEDVWANDPWANTRDRDSHDPWGGPGSGVSTGTDGSSGSSGGDGGGGGGSGGWFEAFFDD
jgi:hypothetical protein